jgi:thiosulfate/3-mercaptopyruvate sulfurtransferase
MIRWIGAALLLLGVASPAWATSNIVDIDFVKSAIARGAVLWDTRDAETYAKGHIPGAVNLGNPNDELRDSNTEDYLPLPKLAELLGRTGLDPKREIVVYGVRGATASYFAHLTIQYLGGDNVHVYHDGIDGWRAAGQRISLVPATPIPVAVTLSGRPGYTVSTREVLAALESPQVQLIDARTAREFRGEDIRSLRGGHIPGAVNIPYEQNWQDPEALRKIQRGQARDNVGMSLRPADDLRKLYAGLDPRKETIVYCQSGVRAAETATVLKDLGFSNVKVYDSSWLAYGATVNAPANNESFINFQALQSRIASLQSRVDQLEKQIAGHPVAR